jgi:eukaryotic-like serine/threonine-protein kinase
MGNPQFGKYRLIAKLGQGGMADVYLAFAQGQGGFGKLLVVKRLREHLVDDRQFVAMLLDEGRIAARLNHPNVVQTFEVGEVDGQYFLALEYLEGQAFNRIQTRAANTAVQVPTAMQYRILCDVLSGLHHAHELKDYDGQPIGLVHRDVTPHNVFVSYEGQVKVVDFGIAKAQGRMVETNTGVVKGKLAYMAPEQAATCPVDRRADLFSVGVMLWEAATGVRMWKGLTEIPLLRKLVAGEIPASPNEAGHDVPPAIDAICRRALAVDPEARYATALEFRNELEAVLESEAAKGQKASPHAIGELVSNMFADRRKELHNVIESQMAKLKESPAGSLPLAVVSPETVSDSVLFEGRSPPSSVTTTDATVATLDTSRMSWRNSFKPWVFLALAGAILLGAVALFMVQRGPQQREGASASATAQAEPTSARSTGEGAAEITARFSATPANAVLTLDDKALPENPFTGKYPRDKLVHRLRAAAPGHEVVTRELTFDADVQADLLLAPVAAASSAPARQSHGPPGAPPRAAPAKPGAKPKRALETGDPWRE